MKPCNKNIALILIASVIISLSGCGNTKNKTYNVYEKSDNEIEDNVSSNDDIDISDNTDVKEVGILNADAANKGDDNPTPTAIQPIQNIELMIYIVNSNADLDPVYALVPADKELTPKLIVDTVVDSMADQSLFIGVESVTTQGDTVIVSFYKDQPPLKDVGAGFESAILDAIAQSLIENLDEYNKVIYRAEGGPYISGHLEMGIDEVYFEDTP